MTPFRWSIGGLWVVFWLQKSSLVGLVGSCRMPACRARTDTFSNRPDMRIMLPTGAMTEPFFSEADEERQGLGRCMDPERTRIRSLWIEKQPEKSTHRHYFGGQYGFNNMNQNELARSDPDDQPLGEGSIRWVVNSHNSDFFSGIHQAIARIPSPALVLNQEGPGRSRLQYPAGRCRQSNRQAWHILRWRAFPQIHPATG